MTPRKEDMDIQTKLDTARELFETATGGNTVKMRRSNALVFEILEDLSTLVLDIADEVFPPLTEEELAVPPFSSLAQVEEEAQPKAEPSPSYEVEDSSAGAQEDLADEVKTEPLKPWEEAGYHTDPRPENEYFPLDANAIMEQLVNDRPLPSAATEEEDGA